MSYLPYKKSLKFEYCELDLLSNFSCKHDTVTVWMKGTFRIWMVRHSNTWQLNIRFAHVIPPLGTFTWESNGIHLCLVINQTPVWSRNWAANCFLKPGHHFLAVVSNAGIWIPLIQLVTVYTGDPNTSLFPIFKLWNQVL